MKLKRLETNPYAEFPSRRQNKAKINTTVNQIFKNDPAYDFNECPQCHSKNLKREPDELYCKDCGALISENFFDTEPEWCDSQNLAGTPRITNKNSLGMNEYQNRKVISSICPNIQNLEGKIKKQKIEVRMNCMGYGEISRTVWGVCTEIFNTVEISSTEQDEIKREIDGRVKELKRKSSIRDVRSASIFLLSEKFDNSYETAQWDLVRISETEQAELIFERVLNVLAKINQEISQVEALSYLDTSMNGVWSSLRKDIKKAGEKVDTVIYNCFKLPVVLWDSYFFQAFDLKKWRKILPQGYKNKAEKILEEAFSELLQQCDNTSAPGWEVKKREDCNHLTLAGLIETIREMQSKRNIKLIKSVEQVAAAFSISPSTINRRIRLFRKLIK